MTQDLSNQLEQGLTEIGEFFPRLAAAIGILMVGIVVARMFERATRFVLHRIGFDRWMREGGVTEALERAGTTLDPSSVLAKLVFWGLMLIVIIVGANVLGVTAVSVLFSELLSYVPNVLAAVIVLVLGTLLGEFIKDLVLASAGGIAGARTMARAAKAAVILLAAFMALEQLDIAQDIVLVFFIAVVGAAALAAGIAFGIGGREVAAQIVGEWYARHRRSEERANALITHPHEPENTHPSASSRSNE